MWWKKNKWKVVVPVLAVAVLAFAFWYGGNAPGLRGWTVGNGPAPTPSQTVTMETPSPSASVKPVVSPDVAMPTPTDGGTPVETPAPTETAGTVGEPEPTETAEPEPSPTETAQPGPTPAAGENTDARPGGAEGGLSAAEKVALAAQLAGGAGGGPAGDADYSKEQGMELDPDTGKDKYLTDPVPEGKPLPVEPQDVTVSDTAYTCTLSVSCASILDNMDWLDPEKVELVPEDGVIFPPTEVTFYAGESVFNLLQREMKKNKIHMEFVNTPIYNSAYIEGINNLYEFDCGELSGWMFKVNGWFPNYGCSRYALQPGDNVEWVYTCDLGVDVGGYVSVGG